MASNPSIYLHGLSFLCHLAIILTISIVWTLKRQRTGVPNHGTFEFRRSILFAISSAGAFYLLFCLFHYFWWSDELTLATMLDLATRTISLLSIGVYIQIRFFPSADEVFPIFLKLWWCLQLLIASSFLVMDLTLLWKHGMVQTHLWVLDSGSLSFSMLFLYFGFAGKRTVRSVVETDGSSSVLDPLLLIDHEKDGSCEDCDKPNCALSDAGFFSLLTFSWMNLLISLGSRKILDLEDVPNLTQSDTISCVYPKLKCKLESCVQDDGNRDGTGITIHTSNLSIALVLMTWKHILFTAFCALISTLSSYIGPYLINNLVQYLGGTQHFRNEGYVLVLIFVASKIVESLSQRHWFFRVQQAGVRARSALVAMIYKKGLMLSNGSRQDHNSGEIVNLMSIDAERVGDFSWYMHDLWLVPVQILLALPILYANLGLASVATLIATVAVMLINYPIGMLQEKYEVGMMEAKDTRMKSTSEILRNMKILKLQAWEMKFLSRVKDLREKETYWLKKYFLISTTAILAYWGAPIVVSTVTFGACLLIGTPLEAGKVLSALATFRVFQQPLYNLPDAISMLVQTKVSLDRISAFLRLEELQSDAVERLPRGTSEIAVEVTNGSYSWDSSSGDFTLRDLNIQVLHGQSIAVCGAVGSGKSSLLSCMLGELTKLSGTAKLWGKVAYVPQCPWIQGGKVEENILFGKNMDRERYERILETCSLKKDMDELPFGDQTVIGERGINLSGGQKQRIQIARALYEDADIYLLDDPFSAVDAHTKTHLFNECLLGLLASKTVVYVTHQIEFLPSADLVLVMKQGRIAQMGKYNDVVSTDTDILELVNAHQKAFSSFECTNSNFHDSNICRDDFGCIASDFKSQVETSGREGDCCETVTSQQQLIQEEEREKGRVELSVYWKYITTSYKGALVLPILLAQILFQVLQIGSNYWMAWATPVSKESTPAVSSLVLICVYVALSIGSSICVLIRALLVVTLGYKTAVALFDKMHSSIFHAPMSFFDSTPTGRILNRASTDQNELDTNIAYQMGSVAVSTIQLVGTIAVMSLVAWQVFLIFIPTVAACVWYQSASSVWRMIACLKNYYLATARELSRLAGVHKALVIQHFAESFSGSSIIRSFNQESRFEDANFHLSDAYSRPKFYNAIAMEWLCFRLDMLSSVVFAVSLAFLISLPDGTLDPGIAGLAVTYGLSLNMMQAEIIWDICRLESNIISVERILQYTCIPSEPPLIIERCKSDPHWPSHGQIELCNLQVRYSPHMPFVLKGLSCIFPGGRKSGIVGRTGSGKSTLIQTLFRIVDPTVGKIIIDEVDITSIGLHQLRSKLSIIPQDPTMFEGTVRTNLDPLEEYSDAHIWEALDKCQLGPDVRSREAKLDSTVTENGENWSMGQRQLACLGRVLLKRSRILVLDEATASVDTTSDNLIQQTIREHFSESTVITVAHRLTSILDSDAVCLLDNGTIAEFDSPSGLLENKSSLFAKLVSEYNNSLSKASK